MWSKKTCDGEEQGKGDPKKLVNAPQMGRPSQVKKRGEAEEVTKRASFPPT